MGILAHYGMQIVVGCFHSLRLVVGLMALLFFLSTLAEAANRSDESLWKSPCVQRFNQRLPQATPAKEKLTCVNSIQELSSKAFTEDFYQHTRLALTGIKYLNIDPELVMGEAPKPPASKNFSPLSLTFSEGYKLDSCSIAFGKYNNFLFDWFFCEPKRGYQPYIPDPRNEGFIEGKFRGKTTFTSSFQGHKAPVSFCIRDQKRAMRGGIAPGPVLIAVYDLLKYPESGRVGSCFFLTTGPVQVKNWLRKAAGTLMQVGTFPEHPIRELRTQEVIKLYPQLPPIVQKM